MLNLIIGDNASGKTLMLNHLIESCNNSYVFYDAPTSFLDNVPLNKNSIEIVEEALSVDKLMVVSNRIVGLITEDYVYGSTELCRLLTLVCKEVDTVFIDNPESNLNSDDIALLQLALSAISDSTPTVVWLTTHCVNFTYCNYCKAYMVEDGSLVEYTEDNYYENMHSI